MGVWEDPIPDDVDWSAIAFYNVIVDAWNERARAAGGGTSRYAVGSDMQSTSGFGVAQMQNAMTTENFVRNYIKTSINTSNPGNSAVSTWVYSVATLFQECGFPANPDGTYGFRRSRPREILNTSSTTDISGNPRAIGQRAYSIGTGPFAPPFGTYIFNGTAWVLDRDQATSPDLLDSTFSVPNFIKRGKHGGGDYIRSYLFDEVRTVMKKLKRTHAKPIFYNDDPIPRNPAAGFPALPRTGSLPSTAPIDWLFYAASVPGSDHLTPWADQVSYAQGIFGSQVVNGASGGFAIYSMARAGLYGNGWDFPREVRVGLSRTKFLVSSPSNHIDRHVYLHAIGRTPFPGTDPPATSTFYPYGLNLMEDTRTLLTDFPIAAGSGQFGGAIGDCASFPSPIPGDPGWNDTYQWGHTLGCRISIADTDAIVDWTPGFQYSPD